MLERRGASVADRLREFSPLDPTLSLKVLPPSWLVTPISGSSNVSGLVENERGKS